MSDLKFTMDFRNHDLEFSRLDNFWGGDYSAMASASGTLEIHLEKQEMNF